VRPGGRRGGLCGPGPGPGRAGPGTVGREEPGGRGLRAPCPARCGEQARVASAGPRARRRACSRSVRQAVSPRLALAWWWPQAGGSWGLTRVSPRPGQGRGSVRGPPPPRGTHWGQSPGLGSSALWSRGCRGRVHLT
jgi:hypothetical protein